MKTIRLALTTALIIGVYTETGIWTVLFLIGICIFIEMQISVNSIMGDIRWHLLQREKEHQHDNDEKAF